MSLSDGFHAVPPGKIAMVVTHLEMTAPSALRGHPCPVGLDFCAWSPNLETYRDTFRRVGSDWLWFGRLLKSDTELAAMLSNENILRWTLMQGGVAEAILELDFRTVGACELAYFGLTSRLFGTGAGSFLMDQALSHAWARPITRLHLHTCNVDSPQALGFYLRSGFTPTRCDVEIADDPRLLGVLDTSAAPHVPIL
ncbi:MAG: GNAT family N-acetyltransferase [Pseudomonadota bacterium]